MLHSGQKILDKGRSEKVEVNTLAYYDAASKTNNVQLVLWSSLTQYWSEGQIDAENVAAYWISLKSLFKKMFFSVNVSSRYQTKLSGMKWEMQLSFSTNWQ
jgi:hypothetical protein